LGKGLVECTIEIDQQSPGIFIHTDIINVGCQKNLVLINSDG
jgi:hypothetical protein